MKKTITYIMVVALFTAACEKSEFQSDGDFFHLNHKGANMPVWVKGNFDSDVMIVTVHGGPGDSGMEQHIPPGFKMLEEDYLMVYADQRYSGMTQGDYDIKTQTPDQFIEDLEKLVQLLEQKYPNYKRFMIGHSWGGQLSAGYLGRDGHDNSFQGWIDMCGSLRADLEAQMMKNYILERVPAKLAEPDADKAFWQFIIDFYEENPAPGNYTSPEPYWYASAVGGDVYDYEKYREIAPVPYIELIFKSMFSFAFYIDAFHNPESYVLWDQIDYTPELHNIHIPSLMLWGAEDGIVPAGVADYVYENLGTESSQKQVVKIPECCHGPHNETPERFYQEVTSFIETYKNQ